MVRGSQAPTVWDEADQGGTGRNLSVLGLRWHCEDFDGGCLIRHFLNVVW